VELLHLKPSFFKKGGQFYILFMPGRCCLRHLNHWKESLPWPENHPGLCTKISNFILLGREVCNNSGKLYIKTAGENTGFWETLVLNTLTEYPIWMYWISFSFIRNIILQYEPHDTTF